MSAETVATLVHSLSTIQLLPPDQLTEVSQSLLKQCAEPRALASELVKRRWVTAYQATLLLSGKAQELVVGSYVVVERLGEGGMGQVVKARHQKLDRTVAIKMIRKDKDTRPEAIRRFRREIEAASKLAHPNIVQALDADQSGEALFLVMEYVDGTDLARLVKKNGPLPVGQACNAIRQAALGLQHAHEKGLVHRDIKPANLMLSRAGVVKVADLGLARWRRDEGEESASQGLTREGSVIGTVDFVAPEQAVDSRGVDIRADLYSLGCAFYYLLTGQVPFPGGEAIQKLYRHRFEEPKPLEEIRAETPAAVVAVVKRLMAKRPEDRFQTPAELAVDLERLMKAGLKGPATPAPTAVNRKNRGRRPLIYAAFVAFSALAAAAWFLNPFGSGTPVASATPVKLSIQPTPPPPVPRTTPVVAAPTQPQPKATTVAQEPPPVKPTTPVTTTLPAGGPERTLTGHTAQVETLALAPDGQLLASGGFDNTVRLWDWRTGKLVRVLSGHKEPVRCAAFSPDGTRLLVGTGGNWDGKDNALRLWDVSTGTELKRLVGHTQMVTTVVFTADGRKAVSGSWDKQFRLWDLESGKEARPAGKAPNFIQALALTPDNALALAAGRDKAAWIFDVGSGELVRSLNGHTDNVMHVAVSTDGSVVATAGGDKSIRLWNLKTGNELRRLEGHADAPTTVVFSRDGTRLLSAGRDRSIRLWDTRTGQEITCLTSGSSIVRRVIFTADERGAISCSDNQISIWALPR